MMISPCDRVENIVGKKENAGSLYFLLLPQCFQKASSTGSLKVGIVQFFLVKSLVMLTSSTFNHTVPAFNDLEGRRLEEIVGKGENADNQHFLHFPQHFLPFHKQDFKF